MSWLGLVLVFSCAFASSPILEITENGTHFRCGEQTFPISHLNDDYCDCDNGADEPATAACSKHGGLFHCKNEKHKGVHIPSSRAFDGVCDCCDASDELPGTCKDTCNVAAEAENQILRSEIAEQTAGILFAQQAKAKYLSDLSEKQMKKQTLVEQEPLVRAEKDVNEAGLALLNSKIQEVENSITEQFKDEVNSLVETYLVEKAKQDAEKADTNEATAPAEGLPTDPEAQGGLPEFPTPPPEAPDDTQARKDKFDELMKIKFDENQERAALLKEREQTEQKGREISDKENHLKNELQEVENFLTIDAGPDNRFAYMIGQTYTQQSGEWEYKVAPWGEAHQGHTSVGRWARWEDNYTRMKFEGGQKCWGGPDRALIVDLLCGETTQILDIKEPNKCEYLMRFKTPGACSQERLAELQSQLH